MSYKRCRSRFGLDCPSYCEKAQGHEDYHCGRTKNGLTRCWDREGQLIVEELDPMIDASPLLKYVRRHYPAKDPLRETIEHTARDNKLNYFRVDEYCCKLGVPMRFIFDKEVVYETPIQKTRRKATNGRSKR